MDVVQFNFPTRILFGPGARTKLAEVLRAENRSRPLFLTDKGIAGLDFFQAMIDGLAGDGFATAAFSDFEGNPVETHVMAGVEACRAHDADAVVIVGGGAALDVGKAVALMLHHPGVLFDYEDGNPDAPPTDKDMPYIVAIPTTAGTGSEVGRCSVISDNDTHVKRLVFSPRLVPPVVLTDPELTTGLPAGITAATGMDALSHNVEAYASKGFHPMADGIALEGIRLIAQSLMQCVKEPGDLDARGDMLMASTMGATAFQKGLGVVHSCAHALSAVCDMHHGLANALMLPACMTFNMQTVPERLASMATAAGQEATAEAFVDWIRTLNAELGMPGGLEDAGVSEDDIPTLVDIALADCCHPCNPRDVSKEDFEQLFRDAM
jgi:alcohol dehydrogenase class IV